MTTVSVTASSPTTESAQARVQTIVAHALTRLRLQQAVLATGVALTLVAWVTCGLILADKYFSLSKIGFDIWPVSIGLLVLAIPYVLWRALTPRLHRQLAAVLADDRLGLNARLSTALTLDPNDPASAAFREPFYAEVLAHLQKLDLEKAFPIRVPRTCGTTSARS